MFLNHRFDPKEQTMQVSFIDMYYYNYKGKLKILILTCHDASQLIYEFFVARLKNK